MANPIKPYGVTYRPQTAEEFIGPQSVKDAIKNPSSVNLIVGPTGAGKTSIAYLIAKECNGEMVELNAANETGIEKVRELIDKVKHYPLSKDRYVVVIDEAHALSAQAMKALLKEFEDASDEGPIWLVLTNQPDKLPTEFKTRFNNIVLKYPSLAELQVYADEVLEAEGHKNIDELLIDACIEFADNNPRAMLNTLQDAINSGLNNKHKDIDSYINAIGKVVSTPENNLIRQLEQWLESDVVPNQSVMAVYPTWTRILNYIYFKLLKVGVEPEYDRLGEMALNWKIVQDSGAYITEKSIKTLEALNTARGDVLLNGANGVSALIVRLELLATEGRIQNRI